MFQTNAVRLLPALVLLLNGSASAQRVDFVCGNPRLHPGLVLRVSVFTPEGSVPGSVVGPMVRCADGYLVLGLYPGQDDPEYRVPTHTIHRMWARGNARVVGFFTGAVVGAAAGGGLAAVRSDVCFRGTPPAYSTCHGNIAADAFIGGAVGGLLGWVLGRGLPHWSRILP